MIFYRKCTIILLLPALDERIASLKEQIKRYDAEYNTASTAQEKRELRQMINSARETLNRLLDENHAQSGAMSQGY